MTNEQQRKAVLYSISWIEYEIDRIKTTIKTTTHQLTIPHLKQRLKELEADYKTFLKINKEYL